MGVSIVYLDYNRTFSDRAKSLRKNMTTQEKKLWYQFLKNHSLHWYKQRRIGNYIVDFYCADAKLVIEIDGGQHYSEQEIEYDKIRTEYLTGYGLKVLRFTNIDVDKNFAGVCYAITQAIEQPLSHLR